MMFQSQTWGGSSSVDQTVRWYASNMFAIGQHPVVISIIRYTFYAWLMFNFEFVWVSGICATIFLILLVLSVLQSWGEVLSVPTNQVAWNLGCSIYNHLIALVELKCERIHGSRPRTETSIRSIGIVWNFHGWTNRISSSTSKPASILSKLAGGIAGIPWHPYRMDSRYLSRNL